LLIGGDAPSTRTQFVVARPYRTSWLVFLHVLFDPQGSSKHIGVMMGYLEKVLEMFLFLWRQ
jgi:hypothetical protein